MDLQLQSARQHIRLAEVTLDSVAARLMPVETARRYVMLPLWVENNVLVVASADPLDREMLRDAAAECRRPLQPLQAGFLQIRDAVERHYIHTAHPLRMPDVLDLLYFLGYIDTDFRRQVEAEQVKTGDSVEQICRRLEGIKDQALAEVTALINYFPSMRLDRISPLVEMSLLLPWEVVKERRTLPLWWLGKALLIGVDQPPRPDDGFEDISALVGVPVVPVLCPRQAWERIYRQFYLGRSQLQERLDNRAADVLVKDGKLREQDKVLAESISEQTGQPLSKILLENDWVSHADWLFSAAYSAGIPMEQRRSGVDRESIPLGMIERVPAVVARRLEFVPLRAVKDALVVGVAHPFPDLPRLLQILYGLCVKVVLVDPDEISRLQSQLFQDQTPVPSRCLIPELGTMLTRMALINEEQLNEVPDRTQKNDWYLGNKLVTHGYLEEDDVPELLGLQTGIPFIHLDHARLGQLQVSLLPGQVMLDYNLLPLWATKTDLWVAVFDPCNVRGLIAAEKASGLRVIPVLANRSEILAALDRLVGRVRRPAHDSRAHDLAEKMLDASILTQANAAAVLRAYEEEQVPFDLAVSQATGRSSLEVGKNLAGLMEMEFVDLRLADRVAQIIDPLGQPIERTVVVDPVESHTAQQLNLETARRLSALPVRAQNETVVVAFADPLNQEAASEVEELLQKRVIPVLAARVDLEEAILRNLHRRNLGTQLLLDGLITRGQLNEALDTAHTTGVRLGRALVNQGYINWEQLYLHLSEQSSIPFRHLADIDIDPEVACLIDPDQARRYGFLPVRSDGKKIDVAVVDPFNDESLQVAEQILEGKIKLFLLTEKDFDLALDQVFSQNYLDKSISELMERSPEDSAYRVLSARQKIGLLVFGVVSVVWLLLDHWSYLITLNVFLMIFYLAFTSYRFYLIYRSLSRNLEIEVTKEEIAGLKDADLPVYTILVPVYKEAEVLPDLLNALIRLDYPHTKLDIKILMEEDDKETIAAFNNWNPPAYFHGIIVPYGQPKTKPKACNYGLIHARGEMVVIFDAEDLPEADQLKKVVVAFSKAEKDVVCIQSKLNYYNKSQNLLTRWFTIEYSMWFDLFLPGLDAAGAPIPLGGTSNHFRTGVLISAGAWDPYNVTEDADLGIRLYKRGYKTAIVDSTTFEEANSQIYNWIRQRSRWIKGYIQTWLVHMRHPLGLLRSTGWKGFLGFQFTVAGTFVSVLLNPIYWIMTTLWFWKHLPFIERIFPGPVYFIGAFCLFIGNFAFTYMNVAGAMRRGYYEMVKFALLSPIYWGLASVGAWKGFLQLFTQPHFWEKTSHGLYQEPKENGSDTGKDGEKKDKR